VESFPNQVFPAWLSAPAHPPPPPALAIHPLRKQLLKGTKALKCFPPQLYFSQMSSCLHPKGPVPWGVDRPSLWGQACPGRLAAITGPGGTHCTGNRIYGSCCLHTGPPQQSRLISGTPHISCLLPSSAF
jgi:hypothetical protein